MRNLNIKQSQQAQSLLKASPMTFRNRNSKKKLPVFILARKEKVHKSTTLPVLKKIQFPRQTEPETRTVEVKSRKFYCYYFLKALGFYY